MKAWVNSPVIPPLLYYPSLLHCPSVKHGDDGGYHDPKLPLPLTLTLSIPNHRHGEDGGYHDDETVPAGSRCATFASLVLKVRW